MMKQPYFFILHHISMQIFLSLNGCQKLVHEFMLKFLPYLTCFQMSPMTGTTAMMTMSGSLATG